MRVTVHGLGHQGVVTAACLAAAGHEVVGAREASDRARLDALFAPLARRVEWMSPESAETTRHARNAWLGTSVGFMNELARLCEAVGADVDEVARGGGA